MAKIIDLGNGYGRLENYGSPYASLTFPLNSVSLGKLYVTGYLSRDEYLQALLDVGYDAKVAEWKVAVASVTTEQWKARVERAGTV